VYPLASQVKRLQTIGNLMHDPHNVFLFQNNITPTPSIVLADLVEATFDGYAPKANVQYGAAFLNDAGQAQITEDLVNTWTMSGPVTPNTVYGYYITDAAGILVCVERFDQPQEMAGVGDTIQFISRESLPQNLGAAVLEGI
jgi:hypothetical protein